MSKEAIKDIIDLNQKIQIGKKNGTITYVNYMQTVKPEILHFNSKYKNTPNKYLQEEYLKNIRISDRHFEVQNFPYRGRASIYEYSWSAYYYKYDFVGQHYASYSPQLYIVVHPEGLKFGLDYGNKVQEDDKLVKAVINRPDIISEIIKCNKSIPAYTPTEGAAYLAKEEDRLYFDTEESVKSKWSNKIHLIKQYDKNNIPEDIDEVIKETFRILLPLFEKLCMITVHAYEDSPIINIEESSKDTDKLDLSSEYTIDDFLSDVFVDKDTANLYLQNLIYKKNIILQGPPGTGKTFVAKRIAYLILKEKKDENIKTVQFHQSYSYEDFIQGFRPNKNGVFERKEGVFYDFVEKAKKSKESFFFIIDEINRGNLSKIFGEILMLIEADKRGESYALNLTYQPEKEFYIPTNLYLIGTMNTADRSLAMVDYALRRRFRFLDLNANYGQKLKTYLMQKRISTNLIEMIFNRINSLNNLIASDENLGKGFCIGHSYFCSSPFPDETEESWYEKIIQFEIGPMLKEYWFDDLPKAESQINLLLV